METDTSGRVLPILGGNMMSPAFCIICRRPGSDVDELFADPQVVLDDFIGNLYLCRSCALSIAAIFGAQSNEELVELVSQRDNLLVQCATQSAHIQELEQAVASLSNLAVSGFSVPLTSVNGVSSTVTEAEQNTYEGLPELTEQRTDESPEPTEPSTGERPDDANEPTSDSGLDDFLRNL